MSKTAPRILSMTMLLVMLVSACAPKALVTPTAEQATEAATETATEAVTESVPTEPPALVTVTVSPTSEAPQAQPTPTLITIDLSGPPMEVGSTFTYIDGNVIVAVPEGEFIMGHGEADNPEHTVFVDAFWIHRTEVSNRAFALCVALGQCTSPDPKLNPYFDTTKNPQFRDPTFANDPVVGVTWNQADAYCKMIKGRLPTEAEWEKTARGPEGNIYPWGNASPSCTLANIGRCNPTTKPVNAFGDGKSYYEALNMSGNVFEWVADWYNSSYYSIAPKENPTGPETGSFRSVRSAGFQENSYLAESARRFRFKPAEARNDLGFRCVITDPMAFAPWCQMVAYVGADQGGGAPGDVQVPQPACPNVSGSSFGFCNTAGNKVPAASLNFNPDPLPDGTLFTVPGGCVLDSTTADPNDYYCTGGGAATVQGLCSVPPAPVAATCPVGYTQNGDICEWTGGGTDATACLPGVTYDPLTQCCGSTPGVGDSFTLCPANAPYYSGGVCVPWPSSDFGPLITINVNVGSCGTGSGDNGNSGCTVNADTCAQQDKIFCASTCSCISRTENCP